MVIVNELTSKFSIRVSKKFHVLPDRSYVGMTGFTVHLPDTSESVGLRAPSFMMSSPAKAVSQDCPILYFFPV